MISQSDKFLLNKLIEIRDRGYYANGRDVILLYNRIFSTNLSATSCSSCLRHRISLLEKELRRQEAEEAKALEEAQVAEIEAEIETKEEKEVKDGTSKQRVERKKVNRKKATD
jgi:hypothetical protein